MIHETVPNHGEIRLCALHELVVRTRKRLEGLRARPAHAFYWLTRGQGRIVVGARARGSGPHRLVFVPAGRVHLFEPSRAAQGHALFVPDRLPVPAPDEPLLLRAADIFEQGEVTSFFEHLGQEAAQRQPGREQALESHATLLAVWAERRHRQETVLLDGATATPATRLADRFLDRLEIQLADGHAVGGHARALGVTPTHLSRVCLHVSGRTASRLIRDRLLLEAGRRLVLGAQPISAVGADLGFSSPAYFSRFFLRETGLSPRAFRETGG